MDIHGLVETVCDPARMIEERLRICRTIATLDPDLAEGALRRLLECPHAAIRAEAARGLAAIGSKNSVADLIETMTRDSDAEVRKSAAYALGLIGDNSAAPILTHLLVNEAELPAVRGMAAEALANINAIDSIEALLSTLDSEATEVRFWAVFALGKLAGRDVLPRLEELTQDQAILPGWWSVGREAANAIQLILSRTGAAT